MDLENLENKETLIKDFFTWLFDDNRIIDKDVTLEKEIDCTLAPNYLDAHIYYPKQISTFFDTTAMKRLGRISQLGLAIEDFPNVYHNRLEHSKGVYYKKLEEMLYNFTNNKWKTYIENHEFKLYLLADLIKMAGHDIGHLPLSHVLEEKILSQRGAHEIIGKRIMLENTQIQSLLTSISPDLPNALKTLYEKHILNFQEHDESNYDVDRLDYISRDFLYAGNPVYIPHLQYKSIPIMLDDTGKPKLNSDGSILVDTNQKSRIDVYEYSSLRDIEHFLEIRESGYINIYFSANTHIRENSIGTLFDSFLSSNSVTGKDLNDLVIKLRTSNLNNDDLSFLLEWDDLKFYSEIIDIAENHENENIRLLATMTIPNMKSFLNMIYSHLNVSSKNKNYTNVDKQFLKKIKQLIQTDTPLSRNLRNNNFGINNILILPQNTTFPYDYSNLLDKKLVNTSTCKIRSYNPKEPIYIKDANGKIFELSHHPDRACEWNNKITYLKYTYAYIPFLKLSGLSDNKIEELRNFYNNSSQQTFTPPHLHVKHTIEDKFLQI